MFGIPPFILPRTFFAGPGDFSIPCPGASTFPGGPGGYLILVAT